MAKTLPGIVSSNNSNAGNTDYPEGSARNISAPNAGDGTPWVAEIVNQYDAFFQRMMSEAAISYDGNLDTVPASQFYNAALVLFGTAGYVIDATGIRRTVDNEQTVVSGSDDPTEGARGVWYGPNNPTKAYDFELYGDGIALHYDDSNDRYDWKNKSFTAVASFAFNAGPQQLAGSGSPEGSVSAPVGSTYQRSDGGSGTSVYFKESGTGNTGWVAIGSGGGSVEWTQIYGAAPGAVNNLIVTGIPSTANEVYIQTIGLNSTGSGTYGLKLGDSGGIESTGYSGGTCSFQDTGSVAGNQTSYSTEFVLHSDASNDNRQLEVMLRRMTGNTWAMSSRLINSSGTEQSAVSVGEKTLSGALTQVQLLSNATSFSSGTVRVAYR